MSQPFIPFGVSLADPCPSAGVAVNVCEHVRAAGPRQPAALS
ncbi:hypothetical protein [Hydrogenophaga sp.]|nr:hypothetical protein [Hydrogenophaga sp.]MDO8904983.1 hypothetical protein [Hydrogenophaga sp.]